MEVHAHSHHHGKKTWKAYFWEFFMLFLAVTMGFFVENQREHYVEHQREKQYVRSIANDLRVDITVLDSIINTRKKMGVIIDSLIYLMNKTDPRQHGNEIYYYTRLLPRTFRFYSNDRTLSQLKNAGNWRLIRNDKVSQSILTYDQLVRTLTVYIEQREESVILILYQSINKLFDNRVFDEMLDGIGFRRPQGNPQLLSYDPMVLNEFLNQVHFRKNTNMYFLNVAGKLLSEARKTLALIEKEYHLN